MIIITLTKERGREWIKYAQQHFRLNPLSCSAILYVLDGWASSPFLQHSHRSPLVPSRYRQARLLVHLLTSTGPLMGCIVDYAGVRTGWDSSVFWPAAWKTWAKAFAFCFVAPMVSAIGEGAMEYGRARFAAPLANENSL